MAAEDVTIRRVGPDDAALLDAVAEGVFDHALRPGFVRAFLASPSSRLVVALRDGVVVGMASGVVYGHPDKPLQLFVNEVGVGAPFRRRGIGRRLVDALLRHAEREGCREAWVATEDGNRAARALYGSLGGEEDAERAVVITFALGTDREAEPR